MKTLRMAVATALLLAGGTLAVEKITLKDGAKLYIAPMGGDLHNFIPAELIKRNVPFIIVTDEAAAEYILTGAALEGDNRWFHTVFGGKDKHEGSVQLVNIESKTVVWAGEAGSRSLWWGGLKRGGMRKVAGRLAKRLKKDLFRKN